MDGLAKVDDGVSRLAGLVETIARDPSWGVTPKRAREAVRRIVETANPVSIVAFGSWARGDARPDSDLDLAVTLDESSTVRGAGDIYVQLSGFRMMSIDILASSPQYHDLMKVSANSVHGDIAREGVLLYERGAHGSAGRFNAA